MSCGATVLHMETVAPTTCSAAERRFRREQLRAVPDFAAGVFRVASAKHPGATYVLRAKVAPASGTVTITCSCPCGRTNKASTSKCKHAAGVLGLLVEHHLVVPKPDGWAATIPLVVEAS